MLYDHHRMGREFDSRRLRNLFADWVVWWAVLYNQHQVITFAGINGTPSKHWDEPRFCFILCTIQILIESCCLGTTHYLDKILKLTDILLDETNSYRNRSYPHTLSFKTAFKIYNRRYKENQALREKQSWTAHRVNGGMSTAKCDIFNWKNYLTKKVTLRIRSAD